MSNLYIDQSYPEQFKRPTTERLLQEKLTTDLPDIPSGTLSSLIKLIVRCAPSHRPENDPDMLATYAKVIIRFAATGIDHSNQLAHYDDAALEQTDERTEHQTHPFSFLCIFTFSFDLFLLPFLFVIRFDSIFDLLQCNRSNRFNRFNQPDWLNRLGRFTRINLLNLVKIACMMMFWATSRRRKTSS